MEYVIIDMDDSSKGDLFYRSLNRVLADVARGGLRFFDPNDSRHPPAANANDFFYPPESHDAIEMAACLKNRMTFYVNGQRHTVKSGALNVFLPGDVHTERFYKINLGYQAFWVQILPQYIGFHITCYEPKRGYFLLGKRVDLLLESRQALLALSRRRPLRDDPLLQIEFQYRLLQILLESL